jgi:predicted dehydrogenase
MVNWGILSTAKIGREQVIPAIVESTGASLIAIASRDLAKARSLANHFGAPLSYGSYEELVSSNKIDAVYIPVPTSDHMEWSIKAAKMGKHVLCEKPIALNANDIDKLIQIESETEVIISEAFMVTYHPQWLKVREILLEKKIGKLNQVQGTFTYFNNDPLNMRNRLELGGGGLPDIGVYPVVVTRFVTQEEPIYANAKIKYDQTFKTDIWTSAQIQFEQFELSFYCSTQMALRQHMTFHGDEGRIEVYAPFNARGYGHARITVHSQDNNKIEEYKFGEINQYRLQIEKFSQAIISGSVTDIFNLHESKKNQRVIDAIYQSDQQGASIKI